MTPITNEILIEMHFMEHLYKEVCKFIDSMIIYGHKPVTEADINWIVDRVGDTIYADRLLAQCSLYSALHTKYIMAPKEMEKMVMYGTDIQQLSVDDFIADEPCMLIDNRETRRHGYNYAKETSYKKPNRRRPWE